MKPGHVIRRVEQGGALLPGSCGAGATSAALLIEALLGRLLPLADTLGRVSLRGPAGAEYVQQLTLWLAFAGGLLATRERQAPDAVHGGVPRRGSAAFGRLVACSPSPRRRARSCPTRAVVLVNANREEAKILPGGIPEWVSEGVMPVSLAPDGPALRLGRLASAGGGAWCALAVRPAPSAWASSPSRWPGWPWPCGLHRRRASPGRARLRGHGRLALLLFFSDWHPRGGRLAPRSTGSSPPRRCRPSRCSPRPATSWRRATPPRACCASSGRCSDGCRAGWR